MYNHWHRGHILHKFWNSQFVIHSQFVTFFLGSILFVFLSKFFNSRQWRSLICDISNKVTFVVKSGAIIYISACLVFFQYDWWSSHDVINILSDLSVFWHVSKSLLIRLIKSWYGVGSTIMRIVQTFISSKILRCLYWVGFFVAEGGAVILLVYIKHFWKKELYK